MTYLESKKTLDEIRRDNGEILFRMAISHLIDVGFRHLTEDNVAETCANILQRDDSHSLMTNEFMCNIVLTAEQLSKIDHIHLLCYITDNVEYDVGDRGNGDCDEEFEGDYEYDY